MGNRKKKTDYLAKLHAEQTFHVYNGTNNKAALFKSDEDRRFFLKQYDKFIVPYVDTFTYCLLGNHFHLLIRVKSIEHIHEMILDTPQQDRTEAQKQFLDTSLDERTAHKVLSQQFSRLFTSYARNFIPKVDGRGNLFYRPFKRVLVGSEAYFNRLVYYIHANPKKHGIFKDFTRYYWSSYQACLSDKPTRLCREELLAWFGGRSAFIEFHQQIHDFEDMSDLLMED
jgi:hypothetical protein